MGPDALAPTVLHEQLKAARQAVQQASDTADDRDVREQLASIDEGLEELSGDDKTQESDPSEEGDRLQKLEETLAGLLDETDGATEEEIQEARDAIDTFRQEHSQDW